MRKMEPNDILRVEQDIIATLKNIYDPEIPVNVRTQVAKIPGVERVNVALVFDPPWDKDMMSDEAKLELGFM